MFDPVSISASVAVASTAFNGIKRAFQAGRDLESMSQDLSRWMGAVSDVDNAHKSAKNPSLIKKVFGVAVNVASKAAVWIGKIFAPIGWIMGFVEAVFGFVVVNIVPSAVSGNVITLLLLDDEGACKLKDPPPDAAFSLIFAVMV